MRSFVADRRVPFFLLLLAMGSVACASSTPAQDDEEELEAVMLGQGERLPSVSYAPTAEGNWEKGMAALKDESYLRAERYFRYIRNKYPYSRYAALSDVRVADAQYGRERYREAIFSYENFIRMHPAHAELGYAMFQVGVAYMALFPSDWVLLPPSYEKDQTEVRDAGNSFQRYLKQFPKGEFAKEAEAKLKLCRDRMVAHERYVANYYLKQDRCPGAVGRLEGIRRNYPSLGVSADLLWDLQRCYLKMDEPEKRKEALNALVSGFAETDEAKEAKVILAKLAPKAKAAPQATPNSAPKATAPAKPLVSPGQNAQSAG